jgi:putative endopeptidase
MKKGRISDLQQPPSINEPFAPLNSNNFDPKISAKENFYQWSNGGWMENNPIPLQYPTWNTFTVLRDLTYSKLRIILEELMDCNSEVLTRVEMKLANFYASFMDESGIEDCGLEPLIPLIQTCQEAKVKI